jgi:hypothetical protein
MKENTGNPLPGRTSIAHPNREDLQRDLKPSTKIEKDIIRGGKDSRLKEGIIGKDTSEDRHIPNNREETKELITKMTEGGTIKKEDQDRRLLRDTMYLQKEDHRHKCRQ